LLYDRRTVLVAYLKSPWGANGWAAHLG
jgi:hypothetical protein